MNKIIKYAAIAGILSLIVAVPVGYFEILRAMDGFSENLVSSYVFWHLISLLLYIIFIWGFKIVGERYQNTLLKTTSYLLILSAVGLAGYSILIVLWPSLDNFFVQLALTIIVGAVNILFGIGLLRLKPQFGSVAKAAGVFGILWGISFLTVILAIVALLLTIPLYILLVLILSRAAKKLEIGMIV